MIICATLLIYLIFLFAGLYLYDWATSLWSYTYVIACACYLVSFYVLAGLLSDNPGLAYPDPEVWNEVDPAVKDQAFLEELVDQP